MISENNSETRGPLDMTFEERQNKGFFFQIRRSWEASQRDEFKSACKTANEPDHRIDNVEGFHALCIRKCGCIMGAWRNVLDADHNGKITYGEFCKGARQLGYAGSIKQLWMSLDVDNNGYISLHELDPKVHTMVVHFLALLSEKYGTLDRAWRKGFGKDPHGACDLQELEKVCQVLDYTEADPKVLFNSLQPIPGRGLISIWDLDPECSRKRARGQNAALIEPEAARRPTVSAVLASSTSPRDRIPSMDTLPSQFTMSTLLAGQSTLQYLRQVLRKHYSSTAAAWRTALDPNFIGHTSFATFCNALKDASFYGSVKNLWQEVCQNPEGHCTFTDLDSESAAVLDAFRDQLVAQYGSISQGWQQALDPENSTRVDEASFNARLAQSLQTRTPKKLFNLLRAHHGQRSILLEDLRALLITVTAIDHSRLWSKDGPRLADPTPRALVDARISEEKGMYKEVVTLKDFKKSLVRTYGSLWAAWFRSLDTDQNGLVTQNDFTRACLVLGNKNVRQFWNEMDSAGKGQIIFADFDPPGAQAYDQLKGLLVQKFGSMVEGFRQGLDRQKNKQVDLTIFKEQLQSHFGIPPADGEKLFKRLKGEAGRSFLSIEDIVTPKELQQTNADELYASCRAFTTSNQDANGSRIPATRQGNQSQSPPRSAPTPGSSKPPGSSSSAAGGLKLQATAAAPSSAAPVSQDEPLEDPYPP